MTRRAPNPDAQPTSPLTSAELAPAAATAPNLAAGAPDPKLHRLAMFLQAARDPQIDAAKLGVLRAMAKEDDQEERKAGFLDALAKAKAEFGPIIKRQLVDYGHKDGKGGRTRYKYADLEDVTDAVAPVLAKHGITHSYKVEQTDKKIKVSCILSHSNGYEDTPRSQEGFEDQSGGKPPNHAIQSTVTYLQRQTLKQSLGLSAGRDDDGRGYVDEPEDPPIGQDEAFEIEDLLQETLTELKLFLTAIGAPSVAEMRLSQYRRGKNLLLRKRLALQKEKENGSAHA
jgi:hypothetical protein